MQTQKQYKSLLKEKILIAGLDNAGKSSIQDILNFTSTTAALRRAPSQELEIFDRQFLKTEFTFFVPPGQRKLRLGELHGDLRYEYFTNVNQLVFVVDAKAKERFSEVRDELQRVLEDILELANNCQSFILLAHKQDLKEAANGLEIQKEILKPLEDYFPSVIHKFKIFETTIFGPETIYEVFLKAIAKHRGLNRIDFDRLADWVQKETSAKMVLISDANGLLIGASKLSLNNVRAYAAYIAKMFSALEDYQVELGSVGIQSILLEEENNEYSLISRINCSNDDYLALLIINPKEHIGLTRIINRKAISKLREAFKDYRQ